MEGKGVKAVGEGADWDTRGRVWSPGLFRGARLMGKGGAGRTAGQAGRSRSPDTEYWELTRFRVRHTVIGQMAMMFQIDGKSGKPVYLQLVDQVRYGAASGVLRAGEALPSIRPLAEELGVNRNTVAKAYTELESLGVIETLAGKGCFLKENESPLSKEVRHKLLVARIDEAVVTAHQMQVSSQALRGLVEERVRFFERRKDAVQPDREEKEPIWTPTTPSSPGPNSTGGMEGWTPLTD